VKTLDELLMPKPPLVVALERVASVTCDAYGNPDACTTAEPCRTCIARAAIREYEKAKAKK
jgi:hypothetical protein